MKSRIMAQAPLWLVVSCSLLGVALALPEAAAAAQMQVTDNARIVISGGAGANAWRIRYGTLGSYEKRFVAAGEKRAWFSHAGWLRLIDTESGLVIGRWHLADSIVGLTPADGRVQVETETKAGNKAFHRVMELDPGAQTAVPYWPSGNLMASYGVPVVEVQAVLPPAPGKGDILSDDWEVPPGQDMAALITQLEEAVRRDPASPLFRLALWRVLRQTKDPRAPAVLGEALQVKTTDFTELLRISGFLEQVNEPEAAGTAFERGYRDFLDRGNDPRLMMVLLGKMILYRPWGRGTNLPDLSTAHGRELMERSYRLAPQCEGADLAWRLYAGILEENGLSSEAQEWRARAAQAAQTSVFLMPRSSTLLTDWVILLVIASMIAVGFYIMLLWIRYRPQRRADAATHPHRSFFGRVLSFLSVPYWSLGQRIAFLSIVVLGWIATGFVIAMVQAFSLAGSTPLGLGMGSLAGPTSVRFIENKLPKTPERDLILATAYQQGGRPDQAERLYRSLPQFAEAWNNLGVILKRAGKDQEGKRAFEKALEIDPGLAEAALNLGRPPEGIWAEQYARYFPGRMMLAPPRPERFSTAYFGGSVGNVLVRGLAGPFAGKSPLEAFRMMMTLDSSDLADTLILPGSFLAVPKILVVVLLLAVALFFVPYRSVTQPPSMFSRVLQILFPGMSSAWSVGGGLALVGWIFFAFAVLLMQRIGTPYILTAVSSPGLARAYGLTPGDASTVFRMINPSWVWVYLPPLVLFAVNLILVLASKHSRTASPAGG